jgi:hypothetical protein
MRLPRTVVALGLVSFFTDVSSEMIYPLLPLFLSSVLGVGAFAIGAIEGAAESVASLLKLASGWWSDRMRLSGSTPRYAADAGGLALVTPSPAAMTRIAVSRSSSPVGRMKPR